MQDGWFRSDLALEAAERFFNQQPEAEGQIPGVKIVTEDLKDAEIKLTRVCIETQEGATRLGKAMGTYVTLEVPNLGTEDTGFHKEITRVLAEQLKLMIPNLDKKQVMVVGIGNRDIAPDALGPLVMEHVFITRHLHKTYGRDSELTKGMGEVCAIAPGVMAQTGMETGEILKGIIDQIRPDVVILVDALAARSMRRLSSTIQVTDTGIHPGAGIGNQRVALNKDSLGTAVLAIGVPTVIDAAAIVSDTMNDLMDMLDRENPYEAVTEATRDFEQQEKYQLMREVMAPQMADLFVTPKNIDEGVRQMSFTISEAINQLCHQV